MEKSCLTCEFGEPKKLHNGYYCKFMPKPWKHDNGKGMCQTYESQKETPTKMDKQTAVINHRHMWQWLSENPMANKRDYLLAHNIKPYPNNECFICQYVFQQDGNCSECILQWPGGTNMCATGDNPLYSTWAEETDPTRRFELARQIRNLPERKKLREEDTANIVAREEMLARKRRKEKEERVMQGSHELLGIHQLGRYNIHDTMYYAAIESPPPKLTRAEAIAKTRKQWGWLAHHPKMDKADYFNAEGISEKPIYGCYLCKWVRSSTSIDVPSSECGEECLLSWPGGWCEGENGLHSIWCEALMTQDYQLATAVAYLIYRLPEKKE